MRLTEIMLYVLMSKICKRKAHLLSFACQKYLLALKFSNGLKSLNIENDQSLTDRIQSDSNNKKVDKFVAKLSKKKSRIHLGRKKLC